MNNRRHTHDEKEGIGEGTSFAVVEGIPYVVYKRFVSTGGANMRLEEIEVSTLAIFDHKMNKLRNRLKEFIARDCLKATVRSVNGYNDTSTALENIPNPRYLPASVEERVMARIGRFLADKQWYIDNAIPYKLCIVLTGAPGTGKTNIIRAMAHRFGRNIESLSTNFSMSKLAQCIRSNEDGIIVIEEFDNLFNNDAKRPLSDEDLAFVDMEKSIPRDSNRLPEFLNTLDGVVPLNGQIIVLTTNYPEKLDPAVLRKGRVDILEEIGPYTSDDVHGYIKATFPGISYDESVVFAPIKICDLAQMRIDHRGDFEGLLSSIPKEA